MSTRTILFITGAISFAVGSFAALAERRHHKRKDLDDVSLVPWTTVMVVAMTIAAGCVGFAFRVDD